MPLHYAVSFTIRSKYRHPKIAQQLLELRQQQKRAKATDNAVVALTAAPSNIDHANRYCNTTVKQIP